MKLLSFNFFSSIQWYLVREDCYMTALNFFTTVLSYNLSSNETSLNCKKIVMLKSSVTTSQDREPIVSGESRPLKPLRRTLNIIMHPCWPRSVWGGSARRCPSLRTLTPPTCPGQSGASRCLFEYVIQFYLVCCLHASLRFIGRLLWNFGIETCD